MFTKVVFDSPVSNSSVEEILRAMPKYKDDLEAMCEEYGYHEVVHAIHQAQDNIFKYVDWVHIEELLNDYLWNELIPELVVLYAEVDLQELTPGDLSKAVKEATINSCYHCAKGNVEIDMTHYNAHGPEEVLREMCKYRYDLDEMTRTYSWDEIVDSIYFVRKVFPHVNWERIEELLDDYLWDELIPEYVFAPVQEALSNPEQVLPELKFSDMVSFWLGSDSDIRRVLVNVINAEAEGENGVRIVEERIRHRLKSEPDFFNEVVYGGTCDEDLDYILRCIHENAQNLPEEEWKEEYSHWTRLTTVEQVADDYYGYDELICLIPEWYCDEIHFRLMEEYDDALQKSGNEISRSVNLHS